MCLSFRFLLTITSIGGLIQSFVWTSLAIAGALVYLCVVQVPPYSGPDDFFRVTLVKLYFEGPRCIPNGNYLGKFNEDYKNPDKFQRLLTHDLIFAVIIAYILLNTIYFIVSLLFYRNREVRTAADVNKLVDIIQGWSLLTLVISLLDFLLTFSAICDILSLMKYYKNNCQERTEDCDKATEITYVPVFLAFVASRFLVLWLWNVIFGVIFFINSFCSNKIIKLPPVKEEKLDVNEVKQVKDIKEEVENYFKKEEFQRPYHPNWETEWSYPTEKNIRKSYSLEGITHFREKRSPRQDEDLRSYHGQREPIWPPPHPKHGRRSEDWSMFNEGYVDEGQGPMELEEPSDFNHNLKNFEQGHKKIKILKPPLGKPVSIPVPPPLPRNEACNC